MVHAPYNFNSSKGYLRIYRIYILRLLPQKLRSSGRIKKIEFDLKSDSYNSKSARGILMKFIAHVVHRLLSNIDKNQMYICNSKSY